MSEISFPVGDDDYNGTTTTDTPTSNQALCSGHSETVYTMKLIMLKKQTDSAIGQVANSLQDFVPEVREVVNAVVDKAPDAVDYVENKYDSIVKKYSEGAVGKYDKPVPSDVWWYSWLPPKFVLDRNLRIADTIINGDGWAPPIKETINERIDFIEDQ